MAKVKKIKNKTNITRHPVVIVVCILLVLLVCLGIYWLLTRSDENENNAAEETTSETAENSIETETESEIETTEDEEDTTKQYEGESANTYENITGAISLAKAERNLLEVDVTIDQTLTDGTCTMILKNDEETMNYTTEITFDVQTSLCIFMDIDVSQFTPGTWSIEILMESGNRVGTLTGEVEI